MRLNVILFLFLYPAILCAQIRATKLSVADYDQALEQLILLKDRDSRVPLQRLDTLRPVFWTSGDSAGPEIAAALKDYLPTLQTSIGVLPDKANLLIACWTDSLNEMDRKQLLSASREVPLALLIPKSDDLHPLPEELKRAAHLIVQVPHALPALGVSLLFGGVGSQSRWTGPDSLWAPGQGMDVPHTQRLAYAPSAWVGMDGDRLTDSLDALVEEGIRKAAYPGAQVLVARRGKILFHKAYGYHTYDSLRRVEREHLYDFASLTKVTGALPALMRLYGNGKFDLDAPLKTYLPEFRCSNKAKLEFREMLAHQARLRPWIPYWQGTLKGNARYPWRRRWDPAKTNDGNFRRRTFRPDSSSVYYEKITDHLWLHDSYPKKIYKAIRKSPLRKDNSYVYSGLLFYLLPDIVSRITGEDYESYLDRQFYHKLGAYTITYNPLGDFPEARIVPTEKDTFFRLQLLHGTVHDEGAAMMQGVSGNAGLFGTALDLAKLLQLYLNGGQYGEEHYFSPEAIAEFTRYQFPENNNRRGLGFDKPPLDYVWGESYVAPSASPASYGHSGYTGTFAWVDPKEELIFIFFSNRVYPTRNNRKLYQLNLRPRMHQAVYEAIQDPTLESVDMEK
jgi:CubicO group peptidase (beta-lactamase class C family)